MNWDERRKHLLSRPSRVGLDRLARAVGPGSRVVRTRRLGGGLATATHLVELSTGDRVVVKRYVPGDATPPKEWARLRFVHRLPVPSPEPLAFDPSGEWFGTPALAMGVVIGRPYVVPADVPSFIGEIARALGQLHAAPTKGAPAVMRRPMEWTPPKDLRRTSLVERAIDIIESERPWSLDHKHVVTHSDFHPGNLLWARGRLSGIVDWSAAKVGSRAWDVAYCRTDLAVLLGGDAPGRFLAECGGELPHMRAFSLMCGLNALRWGHLWTMAYNEQGATHLTPAVVKRRAAAFVRSVIHSGL